MNDRYRTWSFTWGSRSFGLWSCVSGLVFPDVLKAVYFFETERNAWDSEFLKLKAVCFFETVRSASDSHFLKLKALCFFWNWENCLGFSVLEVQGSFEALRKINQAPQHHISKHLNCQWQRQAECISFYCSLSLNIFDRATDVQWRIHCIDVSKQLGPCDHVTPTDLQQSGLCNVEIDSVNSSEISLCKIKKYLLHILKSYYIKIDMLSEK
jgi:hypothetical protein